MINTPRLSLEDARAILAACEAKAREIGVDMDIAVTDDSGNLIAFQRMDGARITSIDISIDKAWIAGQTLSEFQRQKMVGDMMNAWSLMPMFLGQLLHFGQFPS